MRTTMFEDYDKYDALGLAELVRKRQVTRRELIEECIARIEERNPRINAVVQKSFDRALAAPHVDGPFGGVPFLLKDLLVTEGGVPTTQGSRYFADFALPHDSELVARQKRAGFVVVGKTASSELGILPFTETAMHGVTRNPWDPNRTPGGSSGGAAAAVAAGIVPLAHGSDGGGSIRIPASCCGLFGMKPTRARNPFGPDAGEGWHGIAVEHGLSRTVRDSAALLDATHGADIGAPYHAPPPERPYLDEVQREPGKLRIAFSARSQLGHKVHPDCVEAVKDAARLCASLGHEVEEAAPPVDAAHLRHAYLVLATAETAAALDEAAAHLGKPLRPRDFEPASWFLAQVGHAHTAAELAAAVHMVHATGRAVARWHEKYDAFLTPTLAAPPVKIGELAPTRAELFGLAAMRKAPSRHVLRFAVRELAKKAFEWAAFTPVANITGQPAMSVPLYWSNGLPIGVQFAGRFGEENVLFRLAAQLEKARPWFTRRPA